MDHHTNTRRFTARRPLLLFYPSVMNTVRSLAFTGLFCLLLVGVAHTQWVQPNGPNRGIVEALAVGLANGVGDRMLFAATSSYLDSGGVYLSTNNGTSWTSVGLHNADVRCLVMNDTSLIAGTSGGGVFLSTDNGSSWIARNAGLTNLYVYSLLMSGTDLFAGTRAGVFHSTNKGTTWTSAYAGLILNQAFTALAVSGPNLIAGTEAGGVYLSTDNGTSWTLVNPRMGNGGISAFAVVGKNLFAGGGGLFASIDNGASWSQTRLEGGLAEALAVSGKSLFVGLSSYSVRGVYVSTNSGVSWPSVNAGWDFDVVTALVVSGPNLFAGTYQGGVWRRPLSEMLTGVADVSGEAVPGHFVLDQNYPNPFNPTTDIRFQVSDFGLVTLRAYDLLGREVATLVNEIKAPGSYAVQFDGAGLASGIYLYRLQSRAKTELRKMTLLK